MKYLITPILVLILTQAAQAQTYFAEVINGKVVRVIVADQAFINSGAVGNPSNWIETTLDGSKRKNYAAPGYDYDAQKDRFVPSKPFPSWSVDDNNGKWKAPKPMPNNPNKFYHWDEIVKDWVEHKAATGNI